MTRKLSGTRTTTESLIWQRSVWKSVVSHGTAVLARVDVAVFIGLDMIRSHGW